MKILKMIFVAALSSSTRVVGSTILTVMNQCSHPVWPVAISNPGTLALQPNISDLQPGQSTNISVPPSWSGSIWGRTRCSTEDSASGKSHCLTGDCGSDTVECGGESNLQPLSTTIAVFTLNATNGLDHYAVSFKNGYNLPIIVVPTDNGGGEQHCTTAGCNVNLTSSCPEDLRYSDESLGCKSACQAFADSKFCCTSNDAAAAACEPNDYTEFFRGKCPGANSFANDRRSIFVCPSTQNYVTIFCPTMTARLTGTESEEKINHDSKWSTLKIVILVVFGILLGGGAVRVAVRLFDGGSLDINCCNIEIYNL